MAALNFPDPNVQTSYTNPDTGITYEWSNGIWKAVRTAQTAPELFVDVDGDNLTGNLTLGTDKIVLNATDGSATFAGDLSIGYDLASKVSVRPSALDESGVYVFEGDAGYTDSLVKAQYNQTLAGSDAKLWEGVGVVSGAFATTSSIFPDGSASFDGYVTSGNGLGAGSVHDNSSVILNNSATQKLTIYDGTNPTPIVNITESGSPTFAGAVNVGSLDYTSNSGVGSEIRNDGLIRVQRASGSASSVYQAWRGNLNTLNISADGSATFASTVKVEKDSENWTGIVDESAIAERPRKVTAAYNTSLAGFENTYVFQAYDYGTNADKFSVLADGSATFDGQVNTEKAFVSRGNDSANYLFQGQNGSGSEVCHLKNDGSATFAGDVHVGSGASDSRITLGSHGTAGTNNSVHARADGANLLFMCGSGGVTKFEQNGTQRLVIDSNGSATFAGDVVTGVTNALANTGSWMQSIGGIYTTRPAGSTDAAFACFQLGSGTPTATIGADGSAYFHETVTANGFTVFQLTTLTNGGQLGYDDPTKSLRLYSNSSIGTNAKTQFHFNQSGTADFTFNEGGNATFGTTTSLGSHFTVSGGQAGSGVGVAEIRNTANSDSSPALVISKTKTTTSYNARFVQFYADNYGTPMGGIVGNNPGNVQFSSLSDVREKENIQSLTGSLEKVKQLEVVEFDWKESGEHVEAGFTAQNVETVFPEYVIDNVAKDGMESRKGITGGLSGGYIAVLTAALQEAVSKIETLEAKVAALEAG